ncbi:MAG: peptide-methionine (S)-S-oxide reductase MsrA [Planctomycetota bacterium]|nr:peptide-methionine (S)-S-oxide reductase MsrA [Planctomycetota bacterium]
MEKAMFGAGCFWSVEARFRETPGVVATAVGYAGGSKLDPTYREVCTDATGHAEVVLVQFDPAKVTFDDLLKVFWENHNPTTLNRQGPDVGSQYRSVIFAMDDAQRQSAEKSKAALAASGRWGARPIVTFIEPAPSFYKAEDYHQQYLEKRGLSTCHGPG